MNERNLLSIVGQLESIKKKANALVLQSDQLAKLSIENYHAGYNLKEEIGRKTNNIRNQVIDLANYYNENVSFITEKTGILLKPIEMHTMTIIKEATLNRLVIECDKVISAFEKASSLSSEESDKLNRLREESYEICDSLEDINFEKNIEEAIKEAEKGHSLASILITSRIIDHAINQIEGDNDEDKIKNLTLANVIESDDKKTKQQILKASRVSRNVFNHKIDAFASSAESLSLLGDCILLLKILSKYMEIKKS